MLNFYLFHRNRSSMDRDPSHALSNRLSLSNLALEIVRGFSREGGRGKRKNEKLLKRAAKPSPTFIINSTLSPMVFYAARWKPIFDEENRPPLPTTTITRSSLPGRVTTRREISRYRRASNLVLTSPRPRGDGGDRRTAAIRALK